MPEKTPTGTGTMERLGAKPRRGWRERVEPGLYRAHRLSCPASGAREPDVNCTCPFQANLPGESGRRYPQNLRAGSLAEALAEKARRQRAARRGPAGSELTVAEFFWDAFLAKSQLRPATKRNYARIFRSYLEPVIGSIPLVQLNEEDLAELVGHLGRVAERRRRATRRRSPDWVRQQLIPLRSALTTAIRWRRIDLSPLQRVDLPDTPPRRPGESDVKDDPKGILSVEQIEGLCRAPWEAGAIEVIARRDESFFRAVYELGLRNSEARGLRWGDIDAGAGKIRIVRQIDPVTADESVTKGKRTRRLPARPELFELLEEWRDLSVRRNGSDPEGYVWQGRDPSRPMPIGLPTQRIGGAQRLAGLVDKQGKPLINLHALRHSRASHLLLAGVPMLEVSRFLGHTSQLVTAETYSHLVPDDEFAEIKALFRRGRDERGRDDGRDGGREDSREDRQAA